MRTYDIIENLINGLIIRSYIEKTYSDNELVHIHHLNEERKLHRDDGPARIDYYLNGNVLREYGIKMDLYIEIITLLKYIMINLVK